MRYKVIGALIVAALAIGVVGVAPAMAAEGPLGSEASGGLTIRPVAPGELGSATNGAASPLINCSIGQVCAWSGIFAGNLSWWPESNTGCHNHADNTPLASGYNGSSYTERIGGYGDVPSHYLWESSGPVYGELCWPA